MAKKNQLPVHRPKTFREFGALNRSLHDRGYIAMLPGEVKNILSGSDGAIAVANDLASGLQCGEWSKGPISKVAWSFEARDGSVEQVSGDDGKPLGLGFVKWGANNNIPNVIPALADALPYTAAPLRYIADLTAGLGVRLMYRFADGSLVEFRDAGTRLKAAWDKAKNASAPRVRELVSIAVATGAPSDGIAETDEEKTAREAYEAWERTWHGYDDENGGDPGAKAFLENNNLDLHLTGCEQDDVKLDIYFPTVGLQRGRRGAWNPKIISVSYLPSHSCRLEAMNEYWHINHVYFSDKWRRQGAVETVLGKNGEDQSNKVVMYPAAMPQQTLSDIRYIVSSNQKTRIKDRPIWIVCPTFYPSGQKPYYPQPAWWSVFTSQAYDFSSTILYDKAKLRENKTNFGKIFYISLDYLEDVFSREGFVGNTEKQQEFIDSLEKSMEDFLSRRENHGKMMRQWMWTGSDGKDHHNVEVVDIAETTNDAAKAGKEELEMSTSPIFLALQVDPRLVGVPMVQASNGGTALREMHLLKQQQLSVKQRLYLRFINIVPTFNGWDEHAEFHIVQQTLTTLDASKTGTKETISGEGS